MTITQSLDLTNLPQERRLVTDIPGPRSIELTKRRLDAVSHSVGVTMPVFAAAGSGGVLVDVDGNSFIDLGSGIAVTGIGNSAAAVVAAVQEQVELFTHTCFMVTPYELYLRVAENLNRITPGDFEKRTALFSTGAEAVENAVKVARHYTGKQAIVAFDHGYHGRTNLTMALTAKSMPYKSGFGPFAPEIYRAGLSYPFRDGGRDGVTAALDAIEQIERQVGTDNLAALLIEPIQGEGGFVVPADGFLPTLAEWARKNSVVFIADEVQTGFGRTGEMFACMHEGVVPDLIVTAKGIAAGLPLAGLTGRSEIMDAPQTGGLGGTYVGSPVACAAAIASLEYIESAGLVERARDLGPILMERLNAMQADDARIGDVRGRGAMAAMEFVKPGTLTPDPETAKAVAAAVHQNGVIVLVCGTYGNVLRFLPPFVISHELLHEGMDVVAAALESTR